MNYQEAKKLFDENNDKIKDYFIIKDTPYRIVDILIGRIYDWDRVYAEMQLGYSNENALKNLGLINNTHLDVILISDVLGKPVIKLLNDYLRDTNQIHLLEVEPLYHLF